MKKTPVQKFEESYIQPKLDRRRQNGSLRKLTPYFPSASSSSTATTSTIIDFSSNDYLGLAQSIEQQRKSALAFQHLPMGQHLLGSTGSRLLTGDSDYAHQLEQQLAKLHKRPSAMLCNSGYDANLSVMSCLSLEEDTVIILDELSHNSIQMGVRFGTNKSNNKSSSTSKVFQFRHNDLQDLERILVDDNVQTSTNPAIIVIESIYSMDGDAAPIKEILAMAYKYNACVIVDEAHGLGVFGDHGLGLLEQERLENHPSLLCSVHTFGKAAGCHGAVVCGSNIFKQFLYNYGRPIIYSTSLPMHSLVSISCSYDTMTGQTGMNLRRKVLDLVSFFRELVLEEILHHCGEDGNIKLVDSFSPIQALIIPGNTRCLDFCKRLWTKSGQTIRLYPIRSPTVPKGEERVRIIIHSHNTQEQVQYLISLISSTLRDMGTIKTSNSRQFTTIRNIDEYQRSRL
jgi:8-amino-7-oxononanoate synthase